MFKENKSRVDVAIALNLEDNDVVILYEDYLKLLNFDKLITIYKYIGDDIGLLDYLFFYIKQGVLLPKIRFLDLWKWLAD